MIYLGNRTLLKTKETHKPKGVRSDGVCDNICYLKSFTKNVGVRKHNMTYLLEKTNSCTYTKPCVCGSLNHSKTCHSDCVLNVRYDDAIVNTNP